MPQIPVLQITRRELEICRGSASSSLVELWTLGMLQVQLMVTPTEQYSRIRWVPLDSDNDLYARVECFDTDINLTSVSAIYLACGLTLSRQVPFHQARHMSASLERLALLTRSVVASQLAVEESEMIGNAQGRRIYGYPDKHKTDF